MTGWWCKMWEHRQMNSNKIIGEECYKWMNSCYLILKCDCQCQCQCQWVILLYVIVNVSSQVVGEATKPNVNLILAANKIKFDKYQQHDNMTILRACFERVRNVMFTSGWLLIWCWHLQVMFSMFNKLLICLCLADLLFLVSNLAISPIYVAQVNNILHSCSR